jgi:hypothetical protein
MQKKVTAKTKKIWKTSFSDVIAANGVEDIFSLVRVGAGQAVSQSGGNLVLTSGTNANSETIIRSKKAFAGNVDLRYSAILSQRIANNNFFVELVDIIGDNLQYVCNSAVSVTVTFPNGANPFSSANVGQSVFMGNFNGEVASTSIPGRYAIASVVGNTVTFTVAGFPVAGSGDCSLFGWNYHHILYDGTTATACKIDCQRNGWASGDTSLTVSTTASPGHLGILTVEDGNVSYVDQLAASTTSLQATVRGSRIVAIPDWDKELFLQVRSVNGSTNPASTTTFTVGFVSIEEIEVETVTLNGVRPQSFQSALPVSIQGAFGSKANVVVDTAMTNNGTYSGNLFGIAVAPVSSNPTAYTTGNAGRMMATLLGQPIVKPYAIPESDWQYAAAAAGILNTVTAVTFKTAAGAGIRNYITGFDIQWEALTTATEIAIRDGASGTVIWRGKIPAGAAGNRDITLLTPLKGTANTLLEVVTLTASVAGAVYFNARGYIAP